MSTVADIAVGLGLNNQQQEALQLTQDAVIAAGAGAGKTQTLTALVCRDLIVDKLNPTDIAVCTFTRSAAAQLAGRVAQHLSALTDTETPVADLSSLYAGTIDSLCARLLREYALAAGLSPGFRVGDERALLPVREAAWHETLDRDGKDAAGTLAEIAEVNTPAFARDIHKAYEQLRTNELFVEELADPDIPEQDDSGLKEELLAALDSLTTHEDVTAGARSKLQQDRAAVANNDVGALSTLAYGKGKKSIAEALAETSALAGVWRQQAIDAQHYPYRLAAVALLRTYARVYRLAKEREQLLDFLDLSEKTLLLFGSSSEMSPRGFRRIYVDEAQDTNPLQLAVLRAALAPGGQLVVVGDANQSLYSFRNADVDGFRRQAAGAAQRVQLNLNYRSQPALLNTINTVCGQIDELAPDLIAMTAHRPQIDFSGPSVDLVGLLAPTGVEHAQPSRHEEAELLARHTLATAAQLGLERGDICVLCSANSEASAYADAFRKLGVPALLVQRRGLLSRPECLDVLAYLRLLAQPDDEEALLRVLSSPFAGVSDLELHGLGAQRQDRSSPLLPLALQTCSVFARQWQQVQQQKDSLSVSALAQFALDEHGYLLALESADATGALRRNVEKLIGLVGLLEREQHGPALLAIVEALEAERDAGIDEGQDGSLPSDIDAVRVMTVHNAKGDEFPLVTVGRLSRSNGSFGSLLHVGADGTVGLSWGGHSDSAAEAIKEVANRVRDEEDRRLFYVAMTRAERHLILGASTKLKKDGTPSWRGTASWLLGPGGAMAACSPEQQPADNTCVGLDDAQPDAAVRVLRYETTSWLQTPLLLAAVPAASNAVPNMGELPDALMPQPLPMTGGPLSYTHLARWQRCSLRRYLEADLALQLLPDQVQAEEDEAFRAETQLEADGSLALPDELVFAQEPDLPLDPGARQFGIRLHELLADVQWTDKRLPEANNWPLSGADRDRGDALLQPLLRSDLADRLAAAELVHCEQRFILKQGDWLLQGVLDVNAAVADGALIIDWKSGADPDDIFSADYALQRKMYALAVLRSDRAPAQVEVVTAHLQTTGVKLETDVFTVADSDRLGEELTSLINKLLTSSVHAAATTPQPFCAGCPGTQRLCPVAVSL